MTGTALTAARRADELAVAAEETVDLLVVGLGVTGAGVALDAASRRLKVVAVEAHDLAFGTSRWSSKLVHGGLRYLAQGQVGIARESAVERGILMTRTAPHLTRALPMIIPLTAAVSRTNAAVAINALRAGDLLRAYARTPTSLLPRPRRISVEETLALIPSVDRRDLRGGLLGYDGQLEDDARLVVALARTAADHGARILTRTRAVTASGEGATLRDELSGETFDLRARAVINATGVWADRLVPEIRLTPSRGTHLVVRSAALNGIEAAVHVPIPGSSNRYVFTVPQPDGLTYVGLTDQPHQGVVPDVPEPDPDEVDFLLTTINSALATPLARGDVAGTFSGLRPLLASEGSTADLSRRHAVLTSESGVITVVGGKLTTYRRMAQDAVDAATGTRGLAAGPCSTKSLPLVGAAPRDVLTQIPAPARLVRKFGTEAPTVLDDAIRITGQSARDLLAPLTDEVPITRAELLWGVTHEGALNADDLLDRRTRTGLVPADRKATLPVAHEMLDAARCAG